MDPNKKILVPTIVRRGDGVPRVPAPARLPEEELPPEEPEEYLPTPKDIYNKPKLTEDELNKLICEKLEKAIDDIMHSPEYHRWVMLAIN